MRPTMSPSLFDCAASSSTPAAVAWARSPSSISARVVVP
jgi:hypothetical protein